MVNSLAKRTPSVSEFRDLSDVLLDVYFTLQLFLAMLSDVRFSTYQFSGTVTLFKYRDEISKKSTKALTRRLN